MIFDYLVYPSEGEWKKITDENVFINELFLNLKNDTNNDNRRNDFMDFYYNFKITEWLMLFNNRLAEIRMTYVFLMHYFKLGIPDDEWAKSGEKGGIKYYPNFEDKHFYYKMMFDYYVDVFYYKYFNVLDLIFHLINVYYRFDIQPQLSFKKKVMNCLKDKNIELHNYINDLHFSEEMKVARGFRNDLTHNYPPNDIGETIVKESSKNRITISGKVGKYVTTREFVENINMLVEKLSKYINELEKHFI